MVPRRFTEDTKPFGKSAQSLGDFVRRNGRRTRDSRWRMAVSDHFGQLASGPGDKCLVMPSNNAIPLTVVRVQGFVA